MKKDMIVRAWKDPRYRASLPAGERAALPESPSGRPMTELGERELHETVGGVVVKLLPVTDPRFCCIPVWTAPEQCM
jgi:mersacidin/lichenicidin family type 2 lantibiotic